jgi:flagellin-like protein
MQAKFYSRGVSPIIGVIIIVAITLVIAGVAAIWFFGFANVSNEDNDDDIYIFNVKLDGGDDTITYSIVSGKLLNTSRMDQKLEDMALTVPIEELSAGSETSIDPGVDLVPGEEYNVKIVINNKLYYENDLIAAP